MFYAVKMSKLGPSASPGSVESHTNLKQGPFGASALDRPAWLQILESGTHAYLLNLKGSLTLLGYHNHPAVASGFDPHVFVSAASEL